MIKKLKYRFFLHVPKNLIKNNIDVNVLQKNVYLLKKETQILILDNQLDINAGIHKGFINIQIRQIT